MVISITLNKKEPRQPPQRGSRRGLYLICRDTISQDFIVAKGVAASCATVTCVAFDGIDSAILDLFYDTNVVGQTVLRTGLAIRRIPIKEDNHARCRFEATVSPLASALEPVNAVDTSGEFGNNADVDIATLVCTPANKASTPRHARSETIPTPVGHAAYISNLRDRNSDDLVIFTIDAIQNGGPHACSSFFQQGIQVFLLIRIEAIATVISRCLPMCDTAR